jgi:O-antigen ligase
VSWTRRLGCGGEDEVDQFPNLVKTAETVGRTMDLTHGFAATAALAIALALIVSTSDSQKVALLLALSLPQLYVVHVFGVYISAEVGLALLLLPLAMVRLRRYRPRGAGFVVGFLVAEVLSIAWSSDVRLAERTILYQVPFIVMLCLAYAVAKNPENTPIRLVSLVAVLALCEATAVIAFRLSPTMEASFLHSGLAQIFVNPNSLAGLFTVLPDNVLDPAKAGGVFTNANVASAYLGVAAFIVAGAALKERRTWLLSAATLIWVAVFFTGSGFGAILAIALPALLWALANGGRRRRPRVAALSVGVAVVGVLQLTGHVHIADDKSLSEGSRLLIWEFAGHEFLRTPFQGQGFGGWQRTFPTYASGRDLLASFPPHNSLIYTWSQAGLLAAGCAVWALARFATGLIRKGVSGPNISPFAGGTAVALVWLVLQSFVENYGLFGDEHIQAPIAFAIAICLAAPTGCESKPYSTTNRADASYRCDLSQSAIPAI